MKASPVWNTNDYSQLGLLSPGYDDFIPDSHLVLIVNTIIDHKDVSAIDPNFIPRATIKSLSIRDAP